jgi:hypothetical protein
VLLSCVFEKKNITIWLDGHLLEIGISLHFLGMFQLYEGVLQIVVHTLA